MSTNYPPGRDPGRGVGEQAKQAASSAGQKIKESAEQLKDQAKERAEQKFGEKKQGAVSEIQNLASALRQTAENYQQGGRTGELLDAAAQKLERLGSNLESKNLNNIVDDVQTFARRNPAAFLGGALALGFLAARFLKASNPTQRYGSSQGYRTSELYGRESELYGGADSWGERPTEDL
jgi:hypothetical protein